MHRGGSTNFFFQVFCNCQEWWLFLEALEKYTGPSSEDGVSLGGFGWSMDMDNWDVSWQWDTDMPLLSRAMQECRPQD